MQIDWIYFTEFGERVGFRRDLFLVSPQWAVTAGDTCYHAVTGSGDIGTREAAPRGDSRSAARSQGGTQTRSAGAAPPVAQRRRTPRARRQVDPCIVLPQLETLPDCLTRMLPASLPDWAVPRTTLLDARGAWLKLSYAVPGGAGEKGHHASGELGRPLLETDVCPKTGHHVRVDQRCPVFGHSRIGNSGAPARSGRSHVTQASRRSRS